MTEKKAPAVTIVPGNSQHIGSRSEQQDSFGFSCFEDIDHIGHAGFLAVVADGMGGLAMGRDASTVAVRTFLETYADKTPDQSIAKILDRCLHSANRAVNKLAKDAGLEGDVGTTLVAVIVHEGKLYRISAGDSRIYLFREGKLKQLTTDYNYGRVLDRMVERGEMGRAEALSHPSRAALTSYLGKAELDEYDSPESGQVELMPGDRILLASDGLFGSLSDEEMTSFLSGDPQHAAEALVDATIALKRPYQDNVTVALLGYKLPPAAELPPTQLKPAETQKESIKEKKRPESSLQQETVQKSGSSKKKWIMVAGILILLGIGGFFAGKFFFAQSDSSATDAKPQEKPASVTAPAGPETKNNDGASTPK